MNYKKVYDSIIESRKVEVLLHDKENYSEEHHIIPKSLGGSDEKYNLVRVTGREHFILHALLVRIYENGSVEYNCMLTAFNNMKANPKDKERYFNSRLFEKYRNEYSKLKSKLQSGDGNSHFGNMWITNESLKENKSINKDDKIPNGWKKGRIDYMKLEENIIKYTELVKLYNESELEWDNFKEENNIKCNWKNFIKNINKYSQIKIIKKENIDIELLKSYYEIYKNNSFSEFCEITGYNKTQTTLTNTLKKHLKIFEYKFNSIKRKL